MEGRREEGEKKRGTNGGGKRERDGEWSRGRAWPQIGHQVVARRPREKDRLRVRRRACASRNRAHARTYTRAYRQSGTRALLQVVAHRKLLLRPWSNPGRNLAGPPPPFTRIICRGDRTKPLSNRFDTCIESNLSLTCCAPVFDPLPSLRSNSDRSTIAGEIYFWPDTRCSSLTYYCREYR